MAIKWSGAGCDAKAGCWITAEGKLLELSKMSPEHIYNCIDFIRTFGGKLTKRELAKLDELEYELAKRKVEI